MLHFRARKVKDICEAKFFSNEFQKISGAKIPESYFLENDSYLFFDRYELIGGYALIKYEKRVLDQIPISSKPIGLQNLDDNSIEITGYFRIKEKRPFLMVCHFLWHILKSDRRFFVYAYDKSNLKLENIYSYGNPFRLYSGIVANLPGMIGEHFENIEIITKWGFFKMWLNLIYRKYLKLR
jgi:hypothetical protein